MGETKGSMAARSYCSAMCTKPYITSGNPGAFSHPIITESSQSVQFLAEKDKLL
jgi:hypothetical protein